MLIYHHLEDFKGKCFLQIQFYVVKIKNNSIVNSANS